MTTNFEFTGIDAIMEKLSNNKYTKLVKRDMVIDYVQKFYAICDFRNLYVEKNTDISISKHKGYLPCGCMYVIQVKDKKINKCLTPTKSNFFLTETKSPVDMSYKIQGNIIITSMPFTDLTISYLSIPTDENEEIMIPDDTMFMMTLESYIKKEVYFELFEDSKINANVFSVVEQDYYWNIGKLRTEFIMPSHGESQVLSNVLNRPLWQNEQEFIHGFDKANYINKLRVHR